MPSLTGVWSKEEVPGQHVFSYRLAEWIANHLPKSEPVFDFGCGLGTYSKYLRDVGFADVTAIEGEDLGELFETEVLVQDLTETVMIGKDAGNVICLEVAEHIPVIHMTDLLCNIEHYCNHWLILSWGIVGQDGYGHVNCMDNYEVIGRMNRLGFRLDHEMTKSARAVIEDHCSWFRNSLLIFEREDKIGVQ